MKKILVFLLLITGLVKAQVVVPKSTTTFSNIVATGNLRVNGSSTLTGNVTTSSITSTGNLDLGCATGSVVSLKSGSSNILQASSSSLFLPNKTRIGSFSTPSATLDVTGTFSLSNQSFSVGTTNLTGGNSGTIAVLSDAVFPVNCISGVQATVGDATTYYFGSSLYTNVWLTNSNHAFRVAVPYNCTLIGYTANFYVSGTFASTETNTIGIRVDGSETVLNSSVTLTTSINTFTASGLSQNVNAGSYVNAYILTNSLATNPTNVSAGITFWFVRRQ